MDLGSLTVEALEERRFEEGAELQLRAPDLWVVLSGGACYRGRQLAPGDLLRVERGSGRLEIRSASVLLHLKVIARTASGAPDSCVARALRLIDADLTRDWSVPLLAKAAGLSRAAFARRFVRQTGRTPARYIRQRRLERARELLWETDRSLAEIASEVGYQSEFAFNRAFKRAYSLTPGAFRRSRVPRPTGIVCLAA